MRAVTDRGLPEATSGLRAGRLCSGSKRDGSRCQRYAIRGQDRCPAHPREGDAPGRPTKFTPEIRDVILRTLASGVGLETCAAVAGIDARTLAHWIKRGEEEQAAGNESEWVDFLRGVTRARAQVRASLAANIRKAAAEGDWRAGAWMLERLDPQTFGKQATVVQHDHTGEINVSMELLGGRQPVEVPRETREKIVALLEEAEADTIDGHAEEL
jgi:hypothetical protein